MIIDPRGMKDVVEWADFLLLPLSFIGVQPRQLDDPNDWQQWAYNVVQTASLEQFQVPDPRYFDDWMEWAFRFNQTVPY